VIVRLDGLKVKFVIATVLGEALVVVGEVLPPYGLVDPLLHPRNANDNAMVIINVVRMNLYIIELISSVIGFV